MGALEEIMRLKGLQTPDDEIIYQLQQRGFSPKSINDALNQSEIKDAVSRESDFQDSRGFSDSRGQNTGTSFSQTTREDDNFSTPSPYGNDAGQGQGFQSDGDYENYERTENQGTYDPSATMQDSGSQAPFQERNQSRTPKRQSQAQSYRPHYYNQSTGTYTSIGSGYDANTIVEISEQVFEEKIGGLRKEIEGLGEFRMLIQTQVEDLSGRLKRMESIIDNLQIAILEKIGSYGDNLQSIKKEMSMMQDSFGKMVNPILNKVAGKPAVKRTRKKRKSSGE